MVNTINLKPRFVWVLFFLSLGHLQINEVIAQPILMDDGYTVSKRFEKYRQLDTNLSLPKVSFGHNQQVQFDLKYTEVEGRELHLDLFHSVNQSRGLLVLVHGGGWRAGNKSHFYPLANLLAKAGYDVATVEYRLSLEAQYPAAVDDLTEAVEWLHHNQSKIKINGNKIVLVGGSSGGHLAALVGAQMNQKRKTALQIDSVVSLDGVLDLSSKLALKFENRKGVNSPLAMWLGGTYESLASLWREASPVTYLGQYSPNLLVISSGQARFTAGYQYAADLVKVAKARFQYVDLSQLMASQRQPLIHTFWLFEPYIEMTSRLILDFIADDKPH